MTSRFSRTLTGAATFAALFLVPLPILAQRLPTTVVPEHYGLAFDVDLARARFGGVETIRVNLAEASRRIVLHALDIQFHEVTVEAGGRSQSAAVAPHPPTQTVALTVQRAIPAGPAEIHIRYTGILNDKLRGFYLSKANGRNYAVTQLESTDARRAFPSFDEPAFKATFSVTLTIDRNDTAISNGRVVSDTPGPGANRHTMTFSETPKMSSYLVAMAVGDFQCVEGAAEDVPIRICATPDKKELGHVALDAAKQILAFYNRYYSIKYPFKKLDVVAVPDFAAGAMENTAAIFYREVDLLADAKTASVANMKRIWSVLAHEMAHQWFGDLVTMRWWDDLWLNEGFATWMEKRPLEAAKPEWHMDVDEMIDTHAAMNLDSLASTRAIHANVETPDEIEGSFDTIAYEKGAAVMRMIEGYLGAETFRKGVNAYLEKHAYGNATSEDFWTAMTAASGKAVDRILPTFVNQPGVPLIDATLACEDGRSRLTLSGQRFFLDPNMARTVPGTPTWEVPICIKTPASKAPTCQIVRGPRASITLESPACVPWAYVNAGAQGYYRTAYSSDELRALASALGTDLTEPERLSLVGDEWALVRAGRHSVADYLSLASGFGTERVNGVLSEVTSRLSFIHDYLTTDRSRGNFERFVQTLLGPLFAELGIEAKAGDNDDRRELRATLIAALGSAGNDSNLSTAAQGALDRALAANAPLDPTAAGAIIAVAASHGDAALWDRMLNASKASTSPAERYRYLYALASFENPALIDKGLSFALTPELRSQDTPNYLSRFLANPVARDRTWTFIKQNWATLAPKVTISLGDVRLVQGLGVFCEAAPRDDIRSFFAAHPLPAASRALDQTIERINNCITIREQQTAALTTWLAAR
jgi:aminopeptidase N